MDLNLSDLVSSALSEADSRVKLAAGESEKDNKGDDISMYPASGNKDNGKDKKKDEDKGKKEKEDKDKSEKTSALNESVDAASYAMKLAEACDHTARLIPKLAEYSPTDRPGPAVQQAGHMTSRTKHTKETPKTLDKDTATHGGGGKGTDLETNEDGGPQKKAAEQFVRHHIAQHRAKTSSRDLLRQYGAKVAQDPSSPQPKISGGKGKGTDLKVEPTHPSRIPDNKGLINMTRRAARTQDTRQGAGKYFSEPAFSAATDKGLQDHFQNTGSAKIAADKEPSPSVQRGSAIGSNVGSVAGLARTLHQMGPDAEEAIRRYGNKGKKPLIAGGLRGGARPLASGALGMMLGGAGGAAYDAIRNKNKTSADKLSSHILIQKLAKDMEDPNKSQEERAHAKALKRALEEKKEKEKKEGKGKSEKKDAA